MRTRKKCTALLVEPDVIDQKEGTSILKRLGYEVMVTGLIQDALQVAQQQGTLNLLVIDAVCSRPLHYLSTVGKT